MLYKLYFSQKLPITLEAAWEFLSSPANLEKITPASLGFTTVHHHGNKKMYQGQIIAYTIRPVANIPINWVTEITAVEKPRYFIDEQRFGPYKFWHHEHWLTEIPGGVLMEDIIYYELRFGVLGRLVHRLKVKNDLDQIFGYRKKVLEEMFGPFPTD